jgi:hypothetical protein
MPMRAYLIGVLLSLACASGFAQDFKVMTFEIDHVRDQKNWPQVAKECSDNAICGALAAAAEAYTGVPFTQIIGASALIAEKRSGEGTAVNVSMPSGYQYCTSEVKLTSIVPRNGPRGSTLLITTHDDVYHIETWTPVRNLGEGRSWVQATFAVTTVRNALAESAFASGQCFRGGKRNILHCRGSGCSSIKDRNQNVSSTPPNADGANPNL